MLRNKIDQKSKVSFYYFLHLFRTPFTYNPTSLVFKFFVLPEFVLNTMFLNYLYYLYSVLKLAPTVKYIVNAGRI